MMDRKPYKNHKDSPALSLYLTSDNSPEMESLSCLWCKRTVADVKGSIDKIISTPMPVQEFDMAINIRCKLCGQNYRVLVNQI